MGQWVESYVVPPSELVQEWLVCGVGRGSVLGAGTGGGALGSGAKPLGTGGVAKGTGILRLAVVTQEKKISEYRRMKQLADGDHNTVLTMHSVVVYKIQTRQQR
jgi:hypothetical protein